MEFNDEAFHASTQDPSSLTAALQFMKSSGSCFDRDHLIVNIFPNDKATLADLPSLQSKITTLPSPPFLFNDGNGPLNERFTPIPCTDTHPLPHLTCCVYYGDNVDDSWHAIAHLQALSSRLPDVAIQVQDSVDGDILLIEAAEVIPDEISPDNAGNRVFIKGGVIHIIKPASVSSDHLPISLALTALATPLHIASKSVQASIALKLKTCVSAAPPPHVCPLAMPVSLCLLVAKHPNVALVAVDAYCAEKDVKSVSTFSMEFGGVAAVEEGAMVKVAGVALTRCLYAKLMASKAAPDGCKRAVKGYGEVVGRVEGEVRLEHCVENGMKVVVGCELLFRRKGVWREIMKRFGGEGEVEDVKGESVDDDAWMSVEGGSDFERRMEGMVGGNGVDESAEFETMTKAMNSFVEGVSDVDGIGGKGGKEVEEEPVGDVCIDVDRFKDILENLVGGGGGGGGAEFDDDEDDDDEYDGEMDSEMDSAVAAMDDELKMEPGLMDTMVEEGDVQVDVSVVKGLMESLLEQEGSSGPASVLLQQLGALPGNGSI